jgi:predicted N-acyltransferase
MSQGKDRTMDQGGKRIMRRALHRANGQGMQPATHPVPEQALRQAGQYGSSDAKGRAPGTVQCRTIAAVETTIRAFTQPEWDACFAGDPESWAFYLACEEAGPPGFSWRYVALRAGGRLVAAVPAFVTEYRLDTTVQGIWKKFTNRLCDLLPGLLSIRLLAFGSPVAEICHLGIAADVAAAERPALLDQLVAALLGLARQEGCGLIGIKDASAGDDPLWRAAALRAGFKRLPGLPTASLDLPYRDVEGYLAGLRRGTRKDMRRKMKAFGAIRVEQRHAIDDVLGQVGALYDETVAHSDLTFEHLPPAYFARVLARLAPQASVFLYWAGDRLVAFNLVIEGHGRLIDKYIGMHYAVVRQYNLYFLSWLTNVRYCIEHGIPVYQSGQAFYGPKVKLGCRLSPNWQYFRHRNPVANAALSLIAYFIRLDRFDAEIGKLVEAERAEAKASEAKASEAKAPEAKPAEAKPIEGRTMEARSAEAKPAATETVRMRR